MLAAELVCSPWSNLFHIFSIPGLGLGNGLQVASSDNDRLLDNGFNSCSHCSSPVAMTTDNKYALIKTDDMCGYWWLL